MSSCYGFDMYEAIYVNSWRCCVEHWQMCCADDCCVCWWGMRVQHAWHILDRSGCSAHMAKWVESLWNRLLLFWVPSSLRTTSCSHCFQRLRLLFVNVIGAGHCLVLGLRICQRKVLSTNLWLFQVKLRLFLYFTCNIWPIIVDCIEHRCSFSVSSKIYWNSNLRPPNRRAASCSWFSNAFSVKLPNWSCLRWEELDVGCLQMGRQAISFLLYHYLAHSECRSRKKWLSWQQLKNSLDDH